MPKDNTRWSMLAIICLYVFANFIVFQSFPPILSLLMKDLGLSHTDAGLLAAVFSLPGVFLVIPLSFYSARIGIKRLGIISLLCLIAGSLLIATANTFGMLLLGRIVAGLGAVALPFVGTEAVAQWFAGNRMGFAMGIYTTCMLGAVIVTLSSFGTVGLGFGWQAAVWITIAVCSVALVLYAAFFKTPRLNHEQPGEPVSQQVKQVFKIGWPVWILGICWGLFNVAMVSVTTFSPDFMYQNGFNLGTAGFFTSVILIVTVILSPFLGHILDKIRYKEILNLVGGAISIVLSFFLPENVGIILVFIIGLGITTTPFAPVTYATVPLLVKPQTIGKAFAIVTTLGNVAFFLGPYLTGFIRDATGSYQYSYWVIAFFYLLVTLLTGVSLLMQVRKNKEAEA
jgi:predicted MFS family arabinose efflux permease